MPRWLPKSAIIAMHGELLAEHGGLSGPVNEDSLGSTLARPQQLDNYGNPPPDIFQLAASYGFGFAKNHCFKDGNKRVSLVAIDVFLALNGYELSAEETNAVFTIESLAAGNISEEELSLWIKENAQLLS
ncbi:MAG: type II toxin-antitoxin system death-on-curing family toxin [Gammaproteobacteria bacterium]|nr:type II toxin-antitoxin system death-on-curing family toxin [Gammaproteobacteria bacterium]